MILGHSRSPQAIHLHGESSRHVLKRPPWLRSNENTLAVPGDDLGSSCRPRIRVLDFGLWWRPNWNARSWDAELRQLAGQDKMAANRM
jgi:hypothetical protein